LKQFDALKTLPLEVSDLPATPLQPEPDLPATAPSSNKGPSADAANPFFVSATADRPETVDKKPLPPPPAIASASGSNAVPSAVSGAEKEKKVARQPSSDSSIEARRAKVEDNSALPSTKEIREASGKAVNVFQKTADSVVNAIRRGVLVVISLIVSFFRFTVYRPWRRILHYTWVIRTGFFNSLSFFSKRLSYVAAAVAVLFLGVAIMSTFQNRISDSSNVVESTNLAALQAEQPVVMAYEDVKPVFPDRRIFANEPNQRGILVPDAILPP
jgi:hypothetical protein